MTVNEIFELLKTKTNEKTFAKRAARGIIDNKQFGLTTGDLRAMAGKILRYHSLALKLWQTKNVDARMLSILIMDPQQLAAIDLVEMVKSTSFIGVNQWYNAYILRQHQDAEQLRNEWLSSKNKWALRSAWYMTARRLRRDAKGLDIEDLLNKIEKENSNSEPEIREQMNHALDYCCIHQSKYRQRAVDVGKSAGFYNMKNYDYHSYFEKLGQENNPK